MEALECLYGALTGLVIVVNAILGQIFILNILKYKHKKEFLETETELMKERLRKEKQK